ncbi:MAG TPA: SHOCT domain-containing protein [Armatimonadota bacterium]|jgi:putative membrane protein|nr:SHOCT domain-containing protein [Armatimonadota bacterium]HPP73744.1 SHOCT domain-containing protein [Armatimonadota bacterium]
MHWWFRDGWWLGGWFMYIFMMLFWILIIVGFILLIRWIAARPAEAGPTMQGSALEILNARYARGEITREQYLDMRKDIESTDRPSS